MISIGRAVPDTKHIKHVLLVQIDFKYPKGQFFIENPQ